MNKKICHISTVHPKFDIRIFHKECRSLLAAGYEIHLIVSANQSETFEGIKIHALPQISWRPFRMIIKPLIAFFKAITTKAKIIHFHDPELIPLGLLLRLTGKVVIYDAHEDLPRQILSKNWIPQSLRDFISHFIEVFETFSAKYMSAIVTATPTIGARFSKHPFHVTVCNYPILEEFKNSNWSKKTQSICYLGGISEMRGIIPLMQSIEHCDCILHLAGEFDNEDLAHRIKQMPGWKRTVFHGFVNREQVATILSQCKIGICTLLPTANYIDALPIKLFEYMAAGIPVVSSHFPIWRKLVEPSHSGISVDPGNAHQIATAINHILQNDSVAQSMGENGLRLVTSEYSWKNESKKLIGLYQRLCEH